MRDRCFALTRSLTPSAARPSAIDRPSSTIDHRPSTARRSSTARLFTHARPLDHRSARSAPARSSLLAPLDHRRPPLIILAGSAASSIRPLHRIIRSVIPRSSFSATSHQSPLLVPSSSFVALFRPSHPSPCRPPPHLHHHLKSWLSPQIALKCLKMIFGVCRLFAFLLALWLNVAPVPAAHRGRPPRRPRDALMIAFNRAASCAVILGRRQDSCRRQVLSSSIVAAHYSEVHGSESKRQSGEKDLAERRISLGNLAGQLSGFVGGGEEVKNAILKGLHSNVNQLEKLLNASCGGEGCCRTDKITLNTYNESLKKHLKDEQKASEKLVDILSECKLNGLDGPLKQLNVEITQKIEELEKEIESLKKLDKDAEKAGQKPKNASEVDKLNKDLQSHNASKKSLDTLKELCGYADKIQKNDVDQNSSTDILKNLTEGLEKFLGYNKDSKGYSGDGIVYSDLDRLCDGVMAFLHGVLNEVHTNDNLQKYNTPLTVPLQKITEALYNRKNFDSSIRVVSDGIKQWVSGVDGKHREVMRPLESFKSDVQYHINAYMEDKTITDQLKNWLSISGLYLQEVQKSEKALDQIDDNLRGKIDSKISFVKQVVENFGAAVNDRNVQLFVEAVNNKLTELPKSVNIEIGTKIQTLQKALNERFDQIGRNIVKLAQAKAAHIQHITSAVKAAEKLADDLLSEDSEKGFKQGYQQKITELFTQINGQLDRFTNESTTDGQKSALLKEFETVQSKVRGLEADVLADLDRLRDEVERLDDDVHSPSTENVLVKGALNKLEEAKRTLDQNTIQPITEAATQLKLQYENLFRTKLEGLAQKFQPFREAIYGENRDSTNPDENSLAKLITKLTTAIGNTGDTNGYGLAGAVNDFDGVAKAQIKKAAERAIKEALAKFKVDESVDEPKIKVAELMQLFEASRKELNAAVEKIQVELDDLKKLPEAVKQHGENAGAYMAELKERITKIKEAIKGISPKVDAAGTAFDSAIQTLETSLGAARTSAGVALPAIQTYLQRQVNNAFNEMEDAVQKMFDAQKKAELKAMHRSVSDHISSVQNAINDNRDMGLKGLMAKLENVTPLLHGSSDRLHLFANEVKVFYETFFDQLTQQEDLMDYSTTIQPVTSALSSLLSAMHEKQHFHHSVSDKIDALKRELHNFTPTKFADASPLLNVIRRGVTRLHEQLRKQYVSRYSGMEFEGELRDRKDIATYGKPVEPVYSLSEYGEKLSKVCLTSINIVYRDLSRLNTIGEGEAKDMITSKHVKNTPLSGFFEKCGFAVSDSKTEQNGEVKNDCTGKRIKELLHKNDNLFIRLPSDDCDTYGDRSPLYKLYRYLHDYCKVCHFQIHASPKQPCNVYHMLAWLTGLRFNPVYARLHEYVKELFPKPKDRKEEAYSNFRNHELSLDATTTFSARDLTDVLNSVCHYSHSVLTTFLGHGHADGVYACDHLKNTLNLFYPSSPGTCFDMLVELLRRLFYQLYYLYVQCCNGPANGGWANCWYGHGVGGSAWLCNDRQCPNQIGDQAGNQSTNQTHRQTCNQNCNQIVNCGLKSPLQSFLEDGLQGFLPHALTNVGCGVKCSLGNHRGQPCKTPMGFTDIAHIASRSQKGEDLEGVLKKFCGDKNSPLTTLCSYITCLAQRPPQTLGDIFAFYYGFLTDWRRGFYGSDALIKHKHSAFYEALSNEYFKHPYTELDPIAIFNNSNHTDRKSSHPAGDLFSISTCHSGCEKTCGLYVQPLTCNTYSIYSSTYKRNYLSWFVYLTETFYDLLKKLYDECNNRCGQKGSKCHGNNCVKSCPTAIPSDKSSSHQPGCGSVVKCPDTLPTLYKYGFTFTDPSSLNGRSKDKNLKRTCKDFCKALEKVDARGKALGDIESRRISLGKLAGQLSGFVGGGEEVKKAIKNGLQSNVNQLEKLLKTSCGDKGCNCDVKNFRDNHLKKLQNTFNDIDEIATRINSLKKDVAEKSEASLRTPSVSDTEIEKLQQENEELKTQIFSQIPELQKEITTVIDAVQSKITELDSKKNSVDSLQRQVNELKKKIEEGKKTGKMQQNVTEKQLKEAEERLQKAKNNFPEKESKSLESHQKSMESLKSLQGLCQHCNDINQPQNKDGKCKDILESLCGGLEKFLGYDNGNYTGEGIVYSDLDRLCDGVMAFLHSVLKDVHDKQPYKVGMENLKRLVDEQIKPKLCHGHEGFKSVIDLVAQGVRGYNEGVKASNKKAKRRIERLLEKVGDSFKKQVSAIHDHLDPRFPTEAEKAEESVKSRLEECLDYAKRFNEALDTGTDEKQIKEAIDDLNPNLRDKVKKAMSFVKDETERFQKLSEKENRDFEAMKKIIQSVLTDHGKKVNEHVCREVTALVTKLRVLVRKILDEMKSVEKNLFNYLQNLTTWIRQADTAVNVALDKIEKIINEVSEDSAFSNVKPIKQAAQELHNQVYELFNAGNKANEAADKQVKAALDKVLKLDRAVRTGLKTTKDLIKGQMKKYVKDQLLKDVKGRVEKILNGTPPSEQKGLKGIESAVREYAGKFSTKETFGDKVLKLWIGDILTTNNTVKSRLGWYIDDNNGTRGLSNRRNLFKNIDCKADDFHEPIKEQIKLKLIEANVYATGGLIFVDSSTGQPAEHLKNVQSFCNAFAKQLDTQLPSINVASIYTNIGNNAELFGDNTNQHDKSNLESAINLILNQLPDRARKAATELEWLADKTKVGTSKDSTIAAEIDAAKGVAEGLAGELGKATGDKTSGGGIYDVDQQILGILEEQIGEDATGAGVNGAMVTKANKTHFVDYDELLKQDKVPTLNNGQLTGNPDEGTFPQAIKKIETEVNEALSEIGKFNGVAQTQFNLVTSNFQRLCDAIMGAAREGKDSAKNQLEELKTKYFKRYDDKKKDAQESIKKIKHELDALLAGPVKRAVDLGEKFLKPEADDLRDETTEKLKQQVVEEVENAKKQLTHHARKNYISTTKLQLDQFADRVTKELDGLPEAIDDDLITGFKGFMGKLAGENTSKKTSTVNIERLSSLVTELSGPDKNKKAKLFKKLSEKFKEFYNHTNEYILGETKREHKENMKNRNPPVDVGDKDPKPFVDMLTNVKDKLDTLLNHLSALDNASRKYIFDTTFQEHLSALHALLTTVRPDSYATESNPLLDVLTKGLTGMHGELKKAYVSTYDSQPWQASHSEKYAKICFTLLSPLYSDLRKLKSYCKSDGQFKKINSHHNNVFGAFFTRCGYDVSNHQNEQNGELRNTIECNGKYIGEELLVKEHNSSPPTASYYLIRDTDDKTNEKEYSVLKQLFDCLHRYHRVSHLTLPQSPKTPSSIYDILRWLSGLPHNAVYSKLKDYMKTLFPKTESQKTMLDSNINPRHLTLPSYPEVTAEKLHTELDRVCRHAERTLITILGTGYSNGIYASDFSNNSHGFLYSSNTISLICTLFDFLKHLYQQLHFLLEQCRHTTALSGWSDCHYGKGVAGYGWQCNRMRCPNQRCDQAFNQGAKQSTNQSGDQSTNLSANQTCDQHPTCGLKSPLQSFLEDGLQGFLPHSVSVKGTGLTCSTCSMSRGIPCKMPMGLPEIAVTASHIKIGNDIVSVLDRFCGRETSCLSALCSMLNCLLPSAPKTLDQMFAFYYHLLSDPARDREHRTDAFNKAVIAANFDNSSTTLDVSKMFGSSNHSENHLRGGLNTLVKCIDNGGGPVHPCGSYLKPLCDGIYGAVSKDHAAKYLSWVLYITGTFYDLLKSLYEECCSNCTKPGTKCNGRGCHKECMVKGGFLYANTTPSHWSECKSIVNCTKTLPTICKYGMYFASKSHLNGERDGAGKRTCEDFCSTLGKAVKEGNALHMLVHKLIPEFLFKIREPFIWTLLALWSLSLLYLLHIAVVRLDVLRIRSHLRSPSSHRIAAQSLLAVAKDARGKALDDIDARRISLGQLAGQLSGFIGKSDEVEKAILYGLHSNVTQLEKLLKTSCGGEGCNCNIMNFRDGDLKTLQEQFNEVDKIATEINSLNKQKDEKSEASGRTPSVRDPEIAELERLIEQIEEKLNAKKEELKKQITQLQTQLNDPKKQIESTINSLNEKIADIKRQIDDIKQAERKKNNHVKDADISIPYSLSNSLETEQAKVQSHKASLESLQTLQRLCGYYDKLENNRGSKENPAKDILDKLTDGLEKFLGYQETSKGYDGSGIVYSDLDRLCDGVMAFLHGVLSGVKHDESVTKYDRLLGSENLDKLLKEFEASIGEGSGALGPQVTAVSGWLERYEGEVKKKCEAVSNALTAIQENITHKHIPEFNNSEGKSLKDLHEKFVFSVADVFEGLTALKANSQGYEALDNGLKGKLDVPLGKIGAAVDVMKNSAAETVFAGQVEHMDKQLDKQRKSVEEEIELQSKHLQKALADEFNNIVSGVNNLDREKRKHFDRIRWTLTATRDNLHIIDGKYSSTLQGSLNEIRQKLLYLNNDASVGGTGTDSQLHKLANSVKSGIQGLNGDLNSTANAIGGAISSAVSNVNNALLALDGKVRDDLDSLKGKIKSDINSYVREGMATLMQGKMDELRKTIYDQEKEKGHLYEIEKKVSDWAKTFAEDDELGFKNTVSGWIDAILEKDGVVNHRLEEYVKDNERHGHFQTDKTYTSGESLREPIREEIMDKLSIDIELCGSMFASVMQPQANIQENIDAVTGGMDIFVQGLQRKLKGVKKEVDLFVKGVVEGIEGRLEKDQSKKKPAVYHGRYLEAAVESVLAALLSTARQVAVELGSFNGDEDDVAKLGEKLQEAITDVTGLGKKLHDALNIPAGPSGPKTLADDVMQGVTQKLNDRIGQDRNAIDLSKKELMENYHKWVTKTEDSGSLRSRIGEITTNLQTYFKEPEINGKSTFRLENTGPFQKYVEKRNQAEQAITEVLKKIKELEGVLQLVDDKRKDAFNKMNDLKKEIEIHLENVETNVRLANEALDEAMKSLQQTLIKARESSKKAVDSLQTTLLEKVQAAFTHVTTEARVLFADQKIAQLGALGKLADEQLTEVKWIITEDSKSGLKGLLNKLKERYVGKIETAKFAPKSNFKDATENVNKAFGFFFYGLEHQEDFAFHFGKVKHSYELLTILLTDLHNTQHFSHKFTTNLDALNNELNDLSPKRFNYSHNPLLLDALKAGMSAFTEQLSRAYVNKYSGLKLGEVFEPKQQGSEPYDKLTPEGRNCAKVCLTIMETFKGHLDGLKDKCNNKGWQMNLSNDLGKVLKSFGFGVSEQGKQNGELRDTSEMDGTKIKSTLLDKKIEDAFKNPILTTWKKESIAKSIKLSNTQAEEIPLIDLVYCIRELFRMYYEVCHLEHIPSAKAPVNIYQMMQWLSGLRFNPMFGQVNGQFNKLLEGLKNEYKLEKAEFPVAVPDKKDGAKNAALKHDDMSFSLGQVCLRSQLTLTALLGHGHPDGRYACEFRTNSDKLSYPSAPSLCFDMLVDILNRVLQQTYFLYSQCRNDAISSGWRDCWYGRGIGGSAWNCNTMQCPNQVSDQSATQNANQTCTQKCNQSVNCGLKSPLQSFLEDGLPGFLPHSFKTPGCKLTCTVSNHNGIPCLTPMGFTDISTAASHTQNGEYLRKVLVDFCSPDSHLNKLCSYLQCLLRRPPQTLGDMLAFYYQFLKNWNKGEHKKTAFDNAVIQANFWNENTTLNVVSIQGSKVHSDKHSKGDLFSLTDCYHKTQSGLPCGKYLQPLFLDIYDIYSKYNASRYLSWVVYCTETFLGLLYDLYESSKKCETPGTRCCNKSCAETCTVKYTDDSGKSNIPSHNEKHNSNCDSIVKCQNMHPTLYKYGFTFGSPNKLSGKDTEPKLKRTCKDFCEALKKVIGTECVLVKLIEDIDEFIWKIRENFSITLLALWSLSLLYLLHIAVVRLDVLRIRSHLKSPASHRIAAQSLLAAARVKALANVKYFSP
ncbi:hypothetical protein, conserved [Babesia ovata]|uniref:C3H1-type domain-containing protein n=1 Tax=Babesia ovata TaxID=189622 RepID=A0A2H6KIX2_9APIC|nr:uncharacterized protein BOVATA_044330 [Babesia ovata]GBE62940.1 hypothetical protein, conserved [Babesia ovata]